MPEGANCVVGFENTDEEIRKRNAKKMSGYEIGIQKEEKEGANIRRSGDQITRGSLVIPEGISMGPAELGILASLGRTCVNVIRRPVAAIIATGEELAMPGRPLTAPQIYNGNSFNIAAQVLNCGGIPKILGIARDNKRSLISKIRRGWDADMIITTGGVSSGDHDLVKDILNEMGELIFWQVHMTPGKSFSFALVRKQVSGSPVVNIPHFALTGNPTASMINFEVLVRPAIHKMAGHVGLKARIVDAVMEASIDNAKSTRRFVWVSIKENNSIYYAAPTSSQVRGAITSIRLADGLAIVPENIRRVEKGEKLKVLLLNWH
jgi:molybdopterin molybdotransferase